MGTQAGAASLTKWREVVSAQPRPPLKGFLILILKYKGLCD